MQRLWETDPSITAEKLAAKYGVTKNAVLGLVRRRGWKNRGDIKPVRTLFDRLQALHDRMDRLLEETKNVGRYAWPPVR